MVAFKDRFKGKFHSASSSVLHRPDTTKTGSRFEALQEAEEPKPNADELYRTTTSSQRQGDDVAPVSEGNDSQATEKNSARRDSKLKPFLKAPSAYTNNIDRQFLKAWRGDDKVTRAPTAWSKKTGRTYVSSGLKTLSGVPFMQQTPGTIVWHYDFKPINHNNDLSEDEKAHLIVVNEKRYYQKGRWWIIVAVEGKEVTEVPIYTFGNKGLVGKPFEELRNYVSLRPLHSDSATFVNQNPSRKALVIHLMANDDVKLKETMVVKATSSRVRDIDVDELKYVGQIDHASQMLLYAHAKEKYGRTRF